MKRKDITEIYHILKASENTIIELTREWEDGSVHAEVYIRQESRLYLWSAGGYSANRATMDELKFIIEEIGEKNHKTTGWRISEKVSVWGL